jgi:hypothetical protein
MTAIHQPSPEPARHRLSLWDASLISDGISRGWTDIRIAHRWAIPLRCVEMHRATVAYHAERKRQP